MLTVQRIRELLAALNRELARKNIRGEVYLAGGAVMCLEGLPEGWLQSCL